MHKLSDLRIAFALVIVGLLLFSLTPNSPTTAQDKDVCKGKIVKGWTNVTRSEIDKIDLSGKWTSNQNRECDTSAHWQATFPTVITKEDDGYYSARVNSEAPMTVSLNPGEDGGMGIVFIRDLTKGAGKDKDNVILQTWRGKLERNENGNIRIYGTWSGAWAYLKKDNYNLDFMMFK